MINEINGRLEKIIDTCTESSLIDIMTYAVFGGGRRVRPRLLLTACEAFKGNVTDEAFEFAAAIELIHCYSLIHDDLPCMDNDDMRRGKLSCHKKYGEALALLAGDALLSLAAETMAAKNLYVCSSTQIMAQLYVLRAAGPSGMIAGQVRDMTLTNANENELWDMADLKTARLFIGAAMAGAMLGGAEAGFVEQHIADFGKAFGHAFQIKDDMLDYDDDPGKVTFISVYGMETVKEIYKMQKEKVYKLLDEIPTKTDGLKNLVDEVIDF